MDGPHRIDVSGFSQCAAAGWRSVSIQRAIAAIAARSGTTVPSGGICVEGRRDRIRVRIALDAGAEGSMRTPSPSANPGTCQVVGVANEAARHAVAIGHHVAMLQ